MFCIEIIIGILISAAVMHFAAWATGNAHQGFGTAIICVIVMHIAMWIVIGAVTFVACLSWLIAILILVPIALFVSVNIIQSMYQTSWGTAFVMLLITIVVNAGYSALVFGSRLASGIPG